MSKRISINFLCTFSVVIVLAAPPAHSQVQDIGRIEYSVLPLSPTHIPRAHEYVGLRLKIDQFGTDGVLSVSDPDFLDELGGIFYNQTKSVFVGLRFINGAFELLPPVAPAAPAAAVLPAVPFFTVLQAETGTIAVGAPQTEDGDLVLGPREVGSGDVALQLSTAWGSKTKMTIPNAVFNLAKNAAAAYVSLPASLVNMSLASSIPDTERKKAETFFDDTLSFDTKNVNSGAGPNGVNTIVLTKDQLTNGVVVSVKVFDRAANDIPKRKLIVAFNLVSEYRPSVLPNTASSFPTDLKSLFTSWDRHSNIIAADATTSPSGILARVPAGAAGTPSTLIAGPNTFGSACTQLEGDFGQLGFSS